MSFLRFCLVVWLLLDVHWGGELCRLMLKLGDFLRKLPLDNVHLGLNGVAQSFTKIVALVFAQVVQVSHRLDLHKRRFLGS